MATPAPTRYVRFGWAVTDDPASRAEALESGAGLTHVSPFWYALDGDGVLRPRRGVEPEAHAGWLDDLRERGIAILPTVANLNYDADVARALVENERPRSRAVEALARACRDGDFDGLTLAFRGPFPDARDAFSAFVEELAWTLHRAERQLALAVLPQVRDPELDQAPEPESDPEGWVRAAADAFDYRALSVYADLFIVLTLDYPRRPSVRRDADGRPRVLAAPGATAPVGWLESVVDHALLNVPPRSLVLSLPLYGRRWLEGQEEGELVPLRAVEEVLAQAPERSEAPDTAAGGRRIEYVDAEGRRAVLYVDDTESLAEKARLVSRYDLGGLAVWRLGFGTAEAWSALERGLRAGGAAAG